MRTSRKLTVALACPEGTWPHPDWPAPDDPYAGRVVRLSSPFEAREVAEADVVILCCAGDPPDVLHELRAADVPVIVISPRRDAETVLEVFRDGATYLTEGDYSACMLSSAVVGAADGKTYLSPAACAALRDALRMPADGYASERLRELLSTRERQIMELLSTGLGAQEIGQRLRLSEKTIRNNLSNVYAKLGVRGSTEAVLLWLGAVGARWTEAAD